MAGADQAKANAACAAPQRSGEPRVSVGGRPDRDGLCGNGAHRPSNGEQLLFLRRRLEEVNAGLL